MDASSHAGISTIMAIPSSSTFRTFSVLIQSSNCLFALPSQASSYSAASPFSAGHLAYGSTSIGLHYHHDNNAMMQHQVRLIAARCWAL